MGESIDHCRVVMSPRGSLRWQSGQELLVLHAVRLAGFAGTEAIADRVDLANVDIIGDVLRGLAAQQLIERMTFADSDGWILTEAGRDRDAELLRDELEVSGAVPVLHATTRDFESGLNPRLVRVVTDWQLHSPTVGTDRQGSLLRELRDLAHELPDLMADLIGRLPRFARYPHQFSAAWEKARAGAPRRSTPMTTPRPA